MEGGRVRNLSFPNGNDVDANDRALSCRDAERLRPAYESSSGRRQGDFERYAILWKCKPCLMPAWWLMVRVQTRKGTNHFALWASSSHGERYLSWFLLSTEVKRLRIHSSRLMTETSSRQRQLLSIPPQSEVDSIAHTITRSVLTLRPCILQSICSRHHECSGLLGQIPSVRLMMFVMMLATLI
jgi:hypothetical protein